MVRQDAVPIQGEDGSVIGILIGRAGHQQRDPERTEIRGDSETAGGVWFGRVED